MGRLRAAVTAPLAGEYAERPLLAVWLAFALAFVVPVVPLVVVVGYLVRSLAAIERGADLPPFLDDGRGLMRRSIGGSLLCLLFAGLPLAALLVTLYGVVSISAGPGDVPTLRVLAGSTAILFVALVGLYLLPMSMALYGQTGSLRAALAPSTLRQIGGHGAYFAGWTAGCVILTLAAGLATLLGSVPGIGPLLAAGALAYGLLVTVFVWGRAIDRTR